MSPSSSRWLLALASLVVACAPDPSESPPPEDDSADTALDQLLPEFSQALQLPFERSPSRGGEFTLCQSPARPEVNLVNAAWMAFLAQDVYAPMAEFEPLLRKLGFGREPGDDLIEMFTGERGTEVVWAEHPEQNLVVITFRGTEPLSLRDVFLTDGFALPNDLDDEPGWGPGWGHVHAGFLAAFQVTVADKLFARLERLEGTDTKIFVTGHSLGGALAVLFGSRILIEMEAGARYNLQAIYSFGSPRLADDEFTDRFTDLASRHQVTVARVRQGRDVITAIPPGFEHIGDLIHLDRSEVNILPDREPRYLPVPSGIDHRCRNYYGKLIEAIDKRTVDAEWIDCN